VVAILVMITKVATCMAPVTPAEAMNRFMSLAMTATSGSGFFSSNSTARLAGSRTPRATTAMTATTIIEATIHPWCE